MANTNQELWEIHSELRDLSDRLNNAASKVMHNIKEKGNPMYEIKDIDITAVDGIINDITLKIDRFRDEHSLLDHEIWDAEFANREVGATE